MLGGHRVILKILGHKPWDHVKPFTCWFCTQFWNGIAAIIGYQSVFGFDLKQLILFVSLNIIVSKFMDDKFGFDIGFRGRIEELEEENKRLKK